MPVITKKKECETCQLYNPQKACTDEKRCAGPFVVEDSGRVRSVNPLYVSDTASDEEAKAIMAGWGFDLAKLGQKK